MTTSSVAKLVGTVAGVASVVAYAAKRLLKGEAVKSEKEEPEVVRYNLPCSFCTASVMLLNPGSLPSKWSEFRFDDGGDFVICCQDPVCRAKLAMHIKDRLLRKG